MVFGDQGGETVGGGFDVLLPGVRSTVFGYRSGNTVGGGVGEPEESWNYALGRVGGGMGEGCGGSKGREERIGRDEEREDGEHGGVFFRPILMRNFLMRSWYQER